MFDDSPYVWYMDTSCLDDYVFYVGMMWYTLRRNLPCRAFHSINKFCHSSIHPPIHCPVQSGEWVEGGWNLSHWAGQGASLSQGWHNLIHTHIHANGQFRVYDSGSVHVFGLWEETKTPRGNPHWHEGNRLTPHWQNPSLNWTLDVLLWGDSVSHPQFAT